jgi:hypothetical protein
MNLTLFKRLIQIILFLLIFNCNMQQRFNFSPKEKKSGNQKIVKSLAIETFQDLRPKDIESRIGYFFIPSVFWESREWQRRDIDRFTFYKMDLVLTHALKKEFLSYKNLKEVYVATESDSKDVDYLVRGKVLKTFRKETDTLYGLSVFGIFLYPFGLPFSHNQLDTEFDFELVEAKTNKTLLSKKYPARISGLQNIYMESFQNKMNTILQKQLESFAKDCMDVLNK